MSTLRLAAAASRRSGPSRSVRPLPILAPLDALVTSLTTSTRSPRASSMWFLHLEPRQPGEAIQTWGDLIASGRRQLSWHHASMASFLGAHARRMPSWQRLAYLVLQRYPQRRLRLDTVRESWHIIGHQGRTVVFRLRGADRGGEGEGVWVTRDGRVMYAIQRRRHRRGQTP